MATTSRPARALIACLLAFALTSGCATMTGKTAGRTFDDATITATVKADLAAEKASTLTRIDVDTNEGVVYLNGTVASSGDKQRAERIARDVSGVRRVVNNLQVQAG
jgi:hyperosmotically inducible protein